MEKLFELLRQFDTALSACNEINDVTIGICFMPIAQGVLLGGCLYLKGESPIKIDIKSIELYFHEDKVGGYKDPIMYHTDWRLPGFLKKRGVSSYPYFEFGSFNLHQSGVDITFEKKGQYRASFLIREYRVLTGDEDSNTSTKPFDMCSTHIFDDLFPYGVNATSLSMIEWREEKKEGQIKQFPRVGVYCYDEKEDGSFEKNDAPCTKPWRFIRV